MSKTEQFFISYHSSINIVGKVFVGTFFIRIAFDRRVFFGIVFANFVTSSQAITESTTILPK